MSTWGCQYSYCRLVYMAVVARCNSGVAGNLVARKLRHGDTISQEKLSLQLCDVTIFPRKYCCRQEILSHMRLIDAKRSEVAKELELASNQMEEFQYDRIVSYLRTGSSLLLWLRFFEKKSEEFCG